MYIFTWCIYICMYSPRGAPRKIAARHRLEQPSPTSMKGNICIHIYVYCIPGPRIVYYCSTTHFAVLYKKKKCMVNSFVFFHGLAYVYLTFLKNKLNRGIK